jgi:chromosomal replication initiation ATPase DnaA
MQPPIVKTIIASPRDKELMEAVIAATCSYFSIIEQEMITSKKMDVVDIKRICIYLIVQNTSMKDYAIAERFGMTRTPLNAGVDIIETRIRLKIYRQTSDTIKAISDLANNFEKLTHGIYNRTIQYTVCCNCTGSAVGKICR